MLTKLYTPRNISSVVIHYGAGAALLGCSFLFAPVWAVGAAALTIGGLSFWVRKASKNFLENNLVRHPDVHPSSPHLGEIVKGLYEKSGLKAQDYPVYDFRIDEKKVAADKGMMSKLFKEVFNQAAMTHNAAASRQGKTVIMISEPLLKLLDENEQKAVLAHEFAHAVARHQQLGSPQRMIGSVASMASGLTIIAETLSVGWAGIASALGAQLAAGALFKTFYKSGGDENDSEMRNYVKKKKLDSMARLVNRGVAIGMLTLFNPLYLGIYAGCRAISSLTKILSGTMSRSMEYQADRGAVKLGGDPLALMTSLRKMTIIQDRAKKEIFGGDIPKSGVLSKAWKGLLTTHPTLENRVARLSAIAKKQGVSEEAIEKAARGELVVSPENNMPYGVIRAMMRA